MLPAMATRLRVLLYDGAGAARLSPSRRFGLTRALLARGFPVTFAGSAEARGGGRENDGQAMVAPADAADVLVLAESHGAELALERGTGGAEVDAVAPQLRYRDITGVEDAEVVALVEEVCDEVAAPRPGAWKPWFPVIDFDRCTNCMQCLSFCLFDVYGVDEEKNIQVKNPDKCKTNCPACSRVCPEVAILFPKYGSGPINGDTVNDEDVEREKMKVDITALLGGDIYSMLRDRHQRAQSRFSKERDEAKALKERMRCLKKLQDAMEIPPEVLHALPSMDQIRNKAEEAHAAARRARQERAARDAGVSEQT